MPEFHCWHDQGLLAWRFESPEDPSHWYLVASLRLVLKGKHESNETTLQNALHFEITWNNFHQIKKNPNLRTPQAEVSTRNITKRPEGTRGLLSPQDPRVASTEHIASNRGTRKQTRRKVLKTEPKLQKVKIDLCFFAFFDFHSGKNLGRFSQSWSGRYLGSLAAGTWGFKNPKWGIWKCWKRR